MAKVRKRENEVIKRRIKGDSKTQIAKALGISRTTVHAILDKAQTEEAIVAARGQLLGMADIAIKRVEQSIKSPQREGLDASLAVLKGLGVLEERTKSKVEVKNGFESWSDAQLREFIAG
jgi:DNA-binding Lrp family transcriptional regulator